MDFPHEKRAAIVPASFPIVADKQEIGRGAALDGNARSAGVC
ncbi:MAG: hypothetical protein ACFCUG_08410 [Thiotrichales bacterium]